MSEKIKHTPSPWSVGGVSGQEIYGGGRLIANAWTDADARLIAAAPDLLAALEAFLRAPSVGSGGPGSSTIVVQEFNRRAARAAIAKARGESSEGPAHP